MIFRLSNNSVNKHFYSKFHIYAFQDELRWMYLFNIAKELSLKITKITSQQVHFSKMQWWICFASRDIANKSFSSIEILFFSWIVCWFVFRSWVNFVRILTSWERSWRKQIKSWKRSKLPTSRWEKRGRDSGGRWGNTLHRKLSDI